jgi:hypothetical protein
MANEQNRGGIAGDPWGATAHEPAIIAGENPYPAPAPGWSVYELVRFTYPEEDRIEQLLALVAASVASVASILEAPAAVGALNIVKQQVELAFNLSQQRRKGETPCGQVIQLFIGKRVAGPFATAGEAHLAASPNVLGPLPDHLVRPDTGPLLCEPQAAPPTPEPTKPQQVAVIGGGLAAAVAAGVFDRAPDPEAEAEYNAGTTD